MGVIVARCIICLLVSILASEAKNLRGGPQVDPGVFVITHIDTCRKGAGYCILGYSCSVDNDFVNDDLNGHCNGLDAAFNPKANFVCCRENPETFSNDLIPGQHQSQLQHQQVFDAGYTDGVKPSAPGGLASPLPVVLASGNPDREALRPGIVLDDLSPTMLEELLASRPQQGDLNKAPVATAEAYRFNNEKLPNHHLLMFPVSEAAKSSNGGDLGDDLGDEDPEEPPVVNCFAAILLGIRCELNGPGWAAAAAPSATPTTTTSSSAKGQKKVSQAPAAPQQIHVQGSSGSARMPSVSSGAPSSSEEEITADSTISTVSEAMEPDRDQGFHHHVIPFRATSHPVPPNMEDMRSNNSNDMEDQEVSSFAAGRPKAGPQSGSSPRRDDGDFADEVEGLAGMAATTTGTGLETEETSDSPPTGGTFAAPEGPDGVEGFGKDADEVVATTGAPPSASGAADDGVAGGPDLPESSATVLDQVDVHHRNSENAGDDDDDHEDDSDVKKTNTKLSVSPVVEGDDLPEATTTENLLTMGGRTLVPKAELRKGDPAEPGADMTTTVASEVVAFMATDDEEQDAVETATTTPAAENAEDREALIDIEENYYQVCGHLGGDYLQSFGRLAESLLPDLVAGWVTGNRDHLKSRKRARLDTSGEPLEARIIDGDVTSTIMHCWMAAIVEVRTGPGDRDKFVCTGTLVKQDLVITSASCTYKLFQKGSEKFAVVLGDANLNIDLPYGVQTHEIDQVIVHENYKPEDEYHYQDIGMVKLRTLAKLQNTVCLLCLPVATRNYMESSCTVAGYGRGAESRQPLLQDKPVLQSQVEDQPKEVVAVLGEDNIAEGILRKADLPVIEVKECKEQLNYTASIKDEFICVRTGGDGHPCHVSMDGGSPLMCKSRVGDRYELAGLVTFGTSCSSGSSKPSLFTNVSKHVRWIQENYLAAVTS